MTGKAYYITTLADWQRHAPRFAHSHFIVLDSDLSAPTPIGRHAERSDRTAKRDPSTPSRAPAGAGENQTARDSAQDDDARAAGVHSETRILVLIEADEGVHLALEDDAAFEPLPHPLAQKPISGAAQAALAPHGVAPGATTFDAAETLARIHPLLKHRVF
ncbi:MAG TPA: hypothetical protein VMM16_11600 [Verrucomicrobiae bacterium]|nr:hypothetical protein [Verrucomicrobiae bacterium]